MIDCLGHEGVVRGHVLPRRRAAKGASGLSTSAGLSSRISVCSMSCAHNTST